ncbi:PEP-CTERM sorting domain-containing protein [Phycisphaerales bacterium AB-hyl4]|uniref:PEP-CTERM sorting domain-containing protein n=1 Tax=Natronomicrosphaera hydrolytica TaxID=3242702 RepID=A0ABV4U5K3_9BACT
MQKVTGLVVGVVACSMTLSTASAALVVTEVVSEDWSGQSVGDTADELVQWGGLGNAANGIIVDTGGGNLAMQLGQGAGFMKGGLEMGDALGVTMQFDFTTPQGSDGWFGIFYRDTSSSVNPVYRVQWNTNQNVIFMRKNNTNLASYNVGSGFWAGETHTINFEITFDDANNQNLLELFVNGESRMTAEDNGGAGDERRPLPTDNSSIQFFNYNYEATASNLIDNIIISKTIPEPASLSLLALGGMTLLFRRGRACAA